MSISIKVPALGESITEAIVANWLGLVYKLTNLDRRKQYMDGIDPANPLNIND